MNKNHINIPSILKIESGVTGKIGTYLKDAGLTSVTILFGNGLISMFGEKVFKSCEEAGVSILHYQEMDTVDFNDINDNDSAYHLRDILLGKDVEKPDED